MTEEIKTRQTAEETTSAVESGHRADKRHRGSGHPPTPATPPFYYPQLRPLSLPFLEDGDVGRDDFLHKGSCPSVIGGQAFHFREPVAWDIDDLRLLSAIFVGQPVGLGPGLCFTNTA